MEAELYRFLQRSVEHRKQLAETCAPDLLSSARLMAACLMSDGKILVAGDRDTQGIAETFRRQLSYKYHIDRPSLPCLHLESDLGAPYLCSQLRSLGNPGDLLLVIDSGTGEDRVGLIRVAAEKGLSVILLGLEKDPVLGQSLGPNDLGIGLDSMSKAHLLENMTAICLTLAALIDHQLFGSEM